MNAKSVFIIMCAIACMIALLIGLWSGIVIHRVNVAIDDYHLQNLMILYNVEK